MNKDNNWPPPYSRYSDQISSQEQYDKIVKKFTKADKDGNGVLDMTELENLFKSLGCPKSRTQMKKIRERYDIDKSNTIDFSEFIKMAKEIAFRWPPVYEDYQDEIRSEDRFIEIFAAFKMFDTDNNGTINEQELRKALQKMDHSLDRERVRIMLEFVDVDKDGEIQFNEFVKLIEIDDCIEMSAPEAIEQRTKEAFNMMCSENKNVITKNDLKRFSMKVFPAALDDTEIDLIMKIVADGRSEITFEDAKENIFSMIEH